MRAIVSALAAGLLFSVGLGLGGMLDPAKVIGFLDFAGDWDASLAAVMGGAVLSHALLRRWILTRRQKPVAAAAFPTYGESRVTRRLIVGAALFGAGWGLAGYCPGPAIASLAGGTTMGLLFALSMGGGMVLFQLYETLRTRPSAQQRSADVGVTS